MPRPSAERVGRGKCRECSETVTYKKSAGGLLKFDCDSCGAHGYADAGSDAFKAWAASIKGAAPDPAPAKDDPPPPPAPAHKPVRSAFDLGAL